MVEVGEERIFYLWRWLTSFVLQLWESALFGVLLILGGWLGKGGRVVMVEWRSWDDCMGYLGYKLEVVAFLVG